MDQLSPEMKILANLMRNSESEGKNKANMLALVSATLQYLIDLIMDEVDRAGFVTVEFLEKIIFFLRAVTPSYPEDKYEAILKTLIDVDERFANTEFYHGIQSIRQLTTGKSNANNLEVIQGPFKITLDIDLSNSGEMTFFTTYLIENSISYISRLRMSKDSLNLDNIKLKKIIDERYDNCVMQTVLMVEEMSKT